MLGVCLGHEIIGMNFGGEVVHAKDIMHGKTSIIHHNSTGVFSDLPNQIVAARYHSLILKKESIPDCLNITAYTITEDGDINEVMGVSHKNLPIHGVQFHPESILSSCGHHIFANFLGIDLDKVLFQPVQANQV